MNDELKEEILKTYLSNGRGLFITIDEIAIEFNINKDIVEKIIDEYKDKSAELFVNYLMRPKNKCIRCDAILKEYYPGTNDCYCDDKYDPLKSDNYNIDDYDIYKLREERKKLIKRHIKRLEYHREAIDSLSKLIEDV